MEVFQAKGWRSKSSCPPSKVCLPWVSEGGTWDVPGICPGCPGRRGLFERFVQKNLCSSFSSLLSRARGRTATQRSKKGSEKVLRRVLESVLRRVLRSGLSTVFAVKKGPGWRGRWPRGGQRPRRNPQIQQLAMTEHSRTTHARCARSSCNKRQKARELHASFSEITAISILVSPRHRSSDIDLVSI